MTDFKASSSFQARAPALTAILGGAALLLLPGQPAAAQESVEGRAMSLEYALTMPEGWGRFDNTHFFTREDGGRLVIIHTFGENHLQNRHFIGTVSLHEAPLAGLDAQVFTGQARNAFLPVFPERVPLQGTRQIHYFGLCGDAGSAETPQAFAVELISADEFVDAMADAHFAPVLESLALSLPEGAAPCPEELAGRMDAQPAPRPVAAGADGAEGFEVERMGLTLWMPTEFGDPEFEIDSEVVWVDEAMRNDQPGIAIILSTAPSRAEVLDDLAAGEGTIHERRKVALGAAGGFERFGFSMPGEGIGGTFFLSDQPYHAGGHVVLVIGTPIDNLDAARAGIDAIADRIEALNSAN
ncbi:MAG: hypothetical protein JJT95_18475 [Pararhodobacter sp.]|nr:hypothetical protein [Pararhodobacter sp.]